MISVLELRQKRGHLCEWCHKREGVERHHVFIHNSKRFHDELTVEENLMLACSYCHTGVCVLNGLDVRQWFWGVQCERYGIGHMLDWLGDLPDKLRYSRRVDFLTERVTPSRARASRLGVREGAGESVPG